MQDCIVVYYRLVARCDKSNGQRSDPSQIETQTLDASKGGRQNFWKIEGGVAGLQGCALMGNPRRSQPTVACLGRALWPHLTRKAQTVCLWRSSCFHLQLRSAPSDSEIKKFGSQGQGVLDGPDRQA